MTQRKGTTSSKTAESGESITEAGVGVADGATAEATKPDTGPKVTAKLKPAKAAAKTAGDPDPVPDVEPGVGTAPTPVPGTGPRKTVELRQHWTDHDGVVGEAGLNYVPGSTLELPADLAASLCNSGYAVEWSDGGEEAEPAGGTYVPNAAPVVAPPAAPLSDTDSDKDDDRE